MTAPAAAGSRPARLDLRGLVVRFGGLQAVAGVTLTVDPGSITGILGANGSGKTTLLDAISGLVRPSAGTVHFDGENLIDYFPEDRAALGLVRSFQECRLYPELTVEDALLVAEDARGRVPVLASTFRLPAARRAEGSKRRRVGDLMASFGLEPFRHRRIDQLSTGTRRVVDLASIVSARPRLLLLDEPTAGIAQREAEALGPLLEALHRETGATIVMVEHDVPMTVALCDRLVVMEAGRVVSHGPTRAVLSDPAAVEAYLGASEEALARSGARSRGRPRARPRPARPTTAPVGQAGRRTAGPRRRP
jgi:ABC-type branched-subunit amino acid transport system ATPase component